MDNSHTHTLALQEILESPDSYNGYLQLTFFYISQNKIKEAQRAIRLIFILVKTNRDVDKLLNFFRENYNSKNIKNEFEYFFKLIHDISRSLSIPSEVQGCRFLIQAIDRFLENISSSDIPVTWLLWWGYFNNILGKYIAGKHCLETYCRLLKNHSFCYRTLAESLLGAWDLNYHPNSGVDFSILQNYDQFTVEAKDHCLYQKLNYKKEEKFISKAIVFLSCDGTYFERLAIAQALSLYESSPDVGVHFHIMNPTPKSSKWISKIQCACPKFEVTYSFEQVNYGTPQSWLRKTYYASARFCRAASFINTENKPVIITDADQIFRKNILDLLSRTNKQAWDVAIFDHWDTHPLLSLYAKFGASFVAVNTTDLAKQYIQHVSFFIEKNLERFACWTLDQIALFTIAKLYKKNDIPVNFFKIPGQEITCAWDSSPNSTVWNSAGPHKFAINTYTNTIRYLLNKYEFYAILEHYYSNSK